MELKFDLRIMPISNGQGGKPGNGEETYLIGGDIIFYEKNTSTVHFAREFKPICLYSTNTEVRQEIISSCSESQFVELVQLISALIGGSVIEKIEGEYIPESWITYRISKQPVPK